MSRQRGSATIMAIAAMLLLGIGATSYGYIANRNVKNIGSFHDGLQAQYSAEAAVRVVYVAGDESVKNGCTKANSALMGWKDKRLNITFPNTTQMGTAVFLSTLNIDGENYDVRAQATVNNASRVAYNRKLSSGSVGSFPTNDPTIQQLVTSALADSTKNWSSGNPNNDQWQIPTKLDDRTLVVKSPGSGTTADWLSIYSQLLFNDTLGYDNYQPKAKLQLIFRVNYYAKLTAISDGASGYGYYYLAQKDTATTTVNAGSPTAYVVQFDPGLHPGFGYPASDNIGNYTDDGNFAWGADFTTSNDPTRNSNWPFGAFLVKKVWADVPEYGANEVWDEGGDYSLHCAFQDNNELAQRYYIPGMNPGQYVPQTNLNLADPATWALQPPSLTPGKSTPIVTQVPTAFGTDLTGKYRVRPPDLQIAYTLGNIAEGNPWQANTYYPVGAKVAVGVWTSDTMNTRMVWVATTAGISGSSKPLFLSYLPGSGATVADNNVIWKAQHAPTPEDVANSILTNDGFSVAKISMADLNFRVDSVNGTNSASEPYSMPFTMLQGSKNEITIELWADNKGNRIHVIRVNDVLALGFNDRAGTTKYNIIPKDWELSPASDPRGTGIRVWEATADFFSSGNYGQTLSEKPSYGIWAK